jgi:hypothetical protein
LREFHGPSDVLTISLLSIVSPEHRLSLVGSIRGKQLNDACRFVDNTRARLWRQGSQIAVVNDNPRALGSRNCRGSNDNMRP